MNKTEQLDGTIADVYGVQILDDVVMEIDVILGEYSIAVQELIAGHKPFDDSIDASRWRDNASQRLLSLIDKTVNEAIGEDEITPIQKNDLTDQAPTNPKQYKVKGDKK